MRRVTLGMRTRMLLGIVAFVVGGCPTQELAPLSPCTVSAAISRVDQAGVSEVDLLFMIDNSGSMAPKQKKLADELPRLLNVLTSGDRCAGLADCALDENTKPTRRFTPVKSLHLGVVTSNMGGIDDPPMSAQEPVRACRGHGDDGVLQNDVSIAVEGVYAKFDGEFDIKYNEGDELIARAPECELGDVPLYQEFDAEDPDSDPLTAAKNFGCVSRVGVRGCPFEQQLEASWKALAPSTGKGDDFVFLDGTKGHGDGENNGFLREEAILAVVLVTDEDDCSVTDAGKVLISDVTNQRLNLLCGENAGNTELMHEAGRYVRGLQSLKPDHKDRVIFAAITGVPREVGLASGAVLDDVLAMPEMQFFEAVGANGVGTKRPSTSCENEAGEVAYPPIRIVQVAKDFGEEGLVYSVCADDYAPALDLLIDKIANKLEGNCLPRPLKRNEEGKVNCEVFELLPRNNLKCDAKYGHDTSGPNGGLVKRTVREGNKLEEREACRMMQVAVQGAPGDESTVDDVGWYYDDFTSSIAQDCTPDRPQRISFKFADSTSELRNGAGATFECFQPVARIDKDAKGFDAINTSCKPGGEECATRSNADDGGYDLMCLRNTCQVACKVNPDCPPGWVCAAAESDPEGVEFCQLPTCPADDSLTSMATSAAD